MYIVLAGYLVEVSKCIMGVDRRWGTQIDYTMCY